MFDWNLAYLSGQTPWDTGQPSLELVSVINRELVLPGRAFDMGCGTGSDAVYLASRGFSVVAADCSSIALARARLRAAAAGVDVRFLEADLCDFSPEIEPVDFVFDRSCYEFARRFDLEGYLATLRRITRPGSKYLLLVRSAAAVRPDDGPPPVRTSEVIAELGVDFCFEWNDSFDLQYSHGSDSLRWSCLMTRRG